MAVLTKNLTPAPERTEALKRNAETAAARASVAGLKTKTWDQLTATEKDGILKAIAINLGIVSPDPTPPKK